MKNTNKNEDIRNKGEKQVQMTSPVVFHAPSNEAVEEATDYVADRFGAALTRLSDR